jgi:hypothetical protein
MQVNPREIARRDEEKKVSISLKNFLPKLMCMPENEKLSSLIKTEQTLLFLKKDLMVIDSNEQPYIEMFAKKAVDALPMKVTEELRNNFLRKIRAENYDTFPILKIDMSALLKETRNIMAISLDQAIVSVLDGNDITQHTFSQNVELLKELSFVAGYLEEMTDATGIYMKKIPFGEFWMFFINHLRRKVRCEQKKAYSISQRILERAARESPQVTDVVIHFKPWSGYDTNDGLPASYLEFLREMNKTSLEWYNTGKIFASRMFKQIINSMPTYEGLV